MDEETKAFVRQRGQDRCEYCRIEQRFYPDFTFHVEHIVAKQHHGSDDARNLALACHLCNRKKGPNLSGIDPESNELTPLFHPRTDNWEDHFRFEQDGTISGLTAIGRTTVDVLSMNEHARVRLRREILRLETGAES